LLVELASIRREGFLDGFDLRYLFKPSGQRRSLRIILDQG
jgi:hypothetical protein